MNPRVVLSRLTDPFKNLALETVLFKHKPVDQRLLFIYFNEPCIVIGRNQNPWAECNLQTNLPLLRRRSGGGAVVHDLQNANFCVQFPRHEFHRSRHLQMIVDAFPHLKLQINDRNDLIMNSRKVSGSSYKIEKEKAYHHATLLLNSELSKFSAALRPPVHLQGKILSSGGTDSVRSPIANTRLTNAEFIEGCTNQFQQLYGPADTESADESWINDEVVEEMTELQSWEWQFGKTPKFRVQLPNGKPIEVVKGKFGESKVPRDLTQLQAKHMCTY